MNDSERLNVATASTYSGSSTLGNYAAGSTSRRTQGALTFSTDTSGILDVFAQVFAQMSTPIVDTSPATSRTELTSSPTDELANGRESDDDTSEADNEAVVKSSDNHANSARDAFLRAIAATNSRTKSTADKSDSKLESNDETRRAANEAKAAKNLTAASQVDTESSTPSQSLGDATLVTGKREKVASNSESEVPVVAPVAATSAVASNAATGNPDAGKAPDAADKSDLQAISDSERHLADQANGNDDRDSRRSSRRGERNRDDSPVADQAKVESRSTSPATSTDTSAVSGETPNASAPLAPPAGSINASDVSTPAVVPTAAATAATTGGTATARPTSLSGSSSTSDPTSAIQSTGTTTSTRSGGAEKGSSTKSNSASDAVTRAKLVQRVSKAFQHLGLDGGSIRLRLAPAELGSVRVEIQIQGRKVNARVVAESEAASTILREHLPDLRARLESQGMQVERIEVETDENSFNPSRDSKHQAAQDHEQDSGGHDGAAVPSMIAKRSVSRLVSQAIDLRTPVTATSGVDIRL